MDLVLMVLWIGLWGLGMRINNKAEELLKGEKEAKNRRKERRKLIQKLKLRQKEKMFLLLVVVILVLIALAPLIGKELSQ